MKARVAATALTAGLALAALSAHRLAAQVDNSPGAVVVVVKAAKVCFSDMIRVAGYMVPRRIAIVNVDSEGYRITELSADEGDLVTAGQVLARLTRQAADAPPAGTAQQGGGAAAQGAQGRPQPAAIVLRAPAAGLIVKSTARLREMASPQADPLFQIVVDNELELEVQIPSIHVAKLKPGGPARISVAGTPERPGRVRLVAPDVDQKTQLGKARIAVGSDGALKLGTFGSATIDASRSCEGVAVPRSAVDYQMEGTSVQVVRGRTVERRRVTVGLQSDDSVEIREGVSEGETVVAHAGTSLHDGDKVRPMLAGEIDQVRGR